jgi:hypothetical protein
MRFAGWMVLGLGAMVALATTIQAADKEVILKGTIVCAKCALKEAKACTTAIVVKEQGKDVTYYFEDKGNKEEYHEEVCGGARKEGIVTGVVTEKDGKKWVAPKKVEYARK